MITTIQSSDFNARILSDEKLQVLDVRTDLENATQSLPGAIHIPLDRLSDPKATVGLDALEGELFLLCKSGKRGYMASEILKSQLDIPLVVIDGGLDGLVQVGCTTESRNTSWSLERQVRFTAGLMVVLGCVLSIIFHPMFIGLSLFVGLGLVFAAITDSCVMGLMLARMPWNRQASKS